MCNTSHRVAESTASGDVAVETLSCRHLVGELSIRH